jgi:hypothetical protein
MKGSSNMSKFDERLDEILKNYKQMILDDEYDIKNTYTEDGAKQAIRTLILEEVIDKIKRERVTNVNGVDVVGIRYVDEVAKIVKGE